jgi:hypothetical protein
MSSDEREHTATTARREESELTEQVFARFKHYLDQKVESLSTNISAEASGRSKQIERQAEGQSLKFAGNKDQFLFNAEIQDSLEATAALLNRNDIPTALEKLESALGSVRNRQKKIKLADKSEAGWLVVKEYEAEELASNSEDEKRIRKAQTSALRKKSKAANERAKSRRYASTDTARPSRFDPDDKQFFRGKAYVIYLSIVILFTSPLALSLIDHKGRRVSTRSLPCIHVCSVILHACRRKMFFLRMNAVREGK